MKKNNQENKVVKVPIRKSVSVGKCLPWGLLILVLFAGTVAYLKWGNMATVNGQPISRLKYIKTLEQQDKKQTLDRMIEESLVQSEAAKKGINIDQATVEGEIKKIEDLLKEQGQTLDVVLTMQGMTKIDLEKQIKLQKMIEQLAKPKIEFTQVEIDEFLKTNKAQLPTGVSKEELQTLAKEELTNKEAKNAIGDWLTNTKKDAKIVYK